MYQHYMSRKGSSMQPSGNSLLNRVRNALILVLLAAVILLAIFGGRAISFETETRSTFVHRMQTECNDAVSLVTALSRTAGASSSATLGKIRSHVYAMDTINQLNVGLGGTLVQHLPDVVSTGHSDTVHDVELLAGGWLRTLTDQAIVQVNSYHHQAINRLAPSLRACAVGPEGVIEAVERPASRFFKAVQWHPERWAHPLSDAIFAAFVRSAQTYSA